jgi:hypothetical protein
MQTYDIDGVQWGFPLQLFSFGPEAGTARLEEFSIDDHNLLHLVPEPQRTMPVYRLDGEIDQESFRKWNDYRQRAAILQVRNDERIAFSAAELQEFGELHKRVTEIFSRRRDLSPIELTINVADLPFKPAGDGHYKVRMVMDGGQLHAVWEGEIIMLDVEPLDTGGFWTPPDPQKVTVLAYGSPVLFDVEPYIDSNSRVMAPLRAVAAALGASVHWDGAGMTATVERQGRKLLFAVGSTEAIADRERKIMDTIPIIRDGRLLVPVRFLGGFLGARVTWDASTRTVALD